jgi:predicted nucleotidyltransferase
MARMEGLDKAKLVDKVAKDFWFFRNKFFGILVFGSYVKDYQTSVSDIDVCIVTKKTSKEQKSILYNEIFPKIRMDVYDVVIFEDCNNELKSEIAKNHITVYAKDEKYLEDYLEHFKCFTFEKRSFIDIIKEIKGVVSEL